MTNYFQCEFKEVEVKQDKVKIKGFASTPDIDRYNDIVNPKAFKGGIDNYMNNPIVLLQHDNNKPIGKTISYKLTNKGLNVEIEITNDIENTFNLIRDKILKGFSIGFIPKKWEYKMVGDVEIREITEIDLIEISVVSTPANQNSLFTLSKSIKAFFDGLDDNNLNSNINTMKKESIESKVDETLEEKETKVEVSKETETEVSKEKEISDEVESSDERSDESGDDAESETIEETETKEVDVETVEEDEVVDKVDDQADLREEIKSLKDMVEAQGKELNAQKTLADNLVDSFLELSKKSTEVKRMVDSLPIKKGLATLGSESKKVDPLYKQLMEARDNS